MRLRVSALLLCCLLSCHGAAKDSPQFREAFDLFNTLYARSLDDAYGDPQMERVAALLRDVDPKASQAAEAKDLLAKVDLGLSDFRVRQQKIAADEKAADKPANFVGTARLEEPPARPSPPAAGGPSLGMTRDDFLSRFGDCFARRGDYEQGERRGEAFGVLEACEARYPGFTGSLVVLLDNKVTALVATRDLTVRTVDAGGAESAPAAVRTPPPPPAPPRQVRYLPGAPRPELPGEAAPAPP